MIEPTQRTKASMEVVIEETCRSQPHGGDHELGAFVAQRLAGAVASGQTTLGQLSDVARKALADYQAGGS
ncbi:MULTISPECIES: hypothetical protein [unclassified Bradyrhizobium]|uniref:hypothetical protein n=1 Tax=unclassified Bradyrhizobium TaxID=2631580 RepID=UPI0028EBD7D4|nr:MULTISPECIES: hypothetical protein [unclassified Bradyrhizobium]